MKKSLSLVVALALVFSLLAPAMAFAATSQETAAGALLQEYGILTGNSEGDLLLDLELDREDTIVLLSRLMKAEEEAVATENTHGWADVTDPFYHGYISWAKNEGLTKGVGDGSKFGFDQKLSVQELLQFQLRALGYNDVAWNDVPAKAVELGLAAAGENMTANATRGKMAVVTLAALNTTVNGENQTLGAKLGIADFIDEAAIASFTAVGAKKLEVKFNTAVDTEDAKISVKRGPSTVTISNTNWSEDKTTATIETGSKLIEGTYTVTVEGLTEEALTASVNADNERVESIEIPSDVAPIARGTSGADVPNQVAVSYVVKNQYGENVSNLYVPQVTTSVGNQNNASNGVLTITKPSASGNFNINEAFVVTLIYTNGLNTASVSKTLTVGVSAKASEVAITELYNKDENVILTEDTDSAVVGNFKLVLDVKDQYGNAITDTNLLKQDLIVSVGGTHVISVLGYDPTNATATIEEVEIDGVKKPALALANLKSKGSAIVNVVAKYTGKSNNYTVVVEEGLTYDQVTLGSVAGVVAVGEEVLIPATVIDSKGNSITDTKKLNSAIAGAKNGIGVDKLKISVSSPDNANHPATNLQFVLKDGALYYSFKANIQGYHTVSAFTETYKNTHTTVDVKAAATPKVVVGLKSDLNKAILKGDTLELNKDNILVEDNYGRLMSPGALNDSLDGDFRVQIVLAAPQGTATPALSVTGDVYLDKDDKIVLNGDEKGYRAATIQVVDNTDPAEPFVINGSQFSTTLRTVDISEIRSIEIADVGTMYAANFGTVTDYDKTVTVNGITADGAKVKLPNSKFTLTTANANLAAVGDKLHVLSKDVIASGSEATVVVRAVAANGVSAEKEVTLTNAAPRVESVKINNGNAEQTVVVGDGSIELADLKLEIKDQYGVTANIAADNTATFKDGATKVPAISVTFSDLKDVTKVDDNGLKDAVLDVAVGDTFTVTVRVGTVSATAKITVVANPAP